MGSWLMLALVYGVYLAALGVLAKFALRVVALEDAADGIAYARARRQSAAPLRLTAVPSPDSGQRVA